MPTSSTREQIRILFISARSDHGGGPRHLLDILRAFQSFDHNFEVYCASPDQAPYAEQFQKLSRAWLQIPVRSFSASAFFRLVTFISKYRIDIIHSHGRGAGLYSRLLGLFTSSKVIHTFHGIHREPTPIGRIKLLIDQLLAFLSFSAIFVSENEQEEGREFAVVRRDTEQFVIKNAVDLDRFPHTQHRLQSKGPALRIGAFLRADQAKGPDLFLKVAEQFKTQAIWSCAGVTKEELVPFGPIPAMLEICGKITDPSAWLNSIDVFISTSRAEGLPIGVLEAMAAGCICVLSDIPAHRIFNKTDTAVLFEPLHPLALERTLSDIKSGRTSTLVEMISRARKMIEEHHSMPILIQALIKTYMKA